jgi:hypothetical protein
MENRNLLPGITRTFTIILTALRPDVLLKTIERTMSRRGMSHAHIKQHDRSRHVPLLQLALESQLLFLKTMKYAPFESKAPSLAK